MEGSHKLLASLGDRTVIEWVVDAAIGAGLGQVVVVTGHRAAEIESLLPEAVISLRNESWKDGLASSLIAGLKALPAEVDGALILLGDMPRIRAEQLRQIAAEWAPGRIVVPTHGGRRGNPVLWSVNFFGEIAQLTGDRGARSLMERHPEAVVEVPVDSDGVLLDIDAPPDLARERAHLDRGTG